MVSKTNQEKARETLREAGWQYKNGKWEKKMGKQTIVLKLNLLIDRESTNDKKVGNKIKEQLQEVGIIVQIEEVSNKEYEKRKKMNQYELVLQNIKFAYQPALENYLGTENKIFMELLKSLQNIEGEEEKKEVVNQIIQQYKEEIPMISLYYDTLTMLYSSNLSGEVEPNSYFFFYHIENWKREYEKN